MQVYRKIKKISTCKCGAVVAKDLDICPFCNARTRAPINEAKQEATNEQKAKIDVKQTIKKIFHSNIFHFLFAILMIFLAGYLTFAVTDFIATKQFNATKSLLASERMETTVLPSIPETGTKMQSPKYISEYA
jgi:hypothetical protein